MEMTRGGCTFQWKIENISHSWKQFNESPSFIAYALKATKWKLCLYHREWLHGNVSYFLKREKDCYGPENIEVEFQLAFLDKDGSFLKEITISKHGFIKGHWYGDLRFEELNKVFVTQRELFLPDDTLTVQCTIWNTVIKPVDTENLYARTVFKVNRRSFLWRIEDVSTLASGLKNTFTEDSFQFNIAFIEGIDLEKKLMINLTSPDESIKYFSFKISIVDSAGMKEDCGTHEYFETDLKKKGSSTLLFIKKLVENKSQYLPNDVLSLECEYVYSNGDALHEFCSFGKMSTKVMNNVFEIKNERSISEEKPLNTVVLVNDLKSMYNDAILCDIELRTSTRNFPAHKSILSARSPVFRSMFSNDMKEKNSGHVDITDFEDETVHRMLLYMYTDTLDDLQYERASKLYSISDKYQILSLKDRCSSFLKENLCPTVACDILLLSDLHNDDDLKNVVEDYIFKQKKEIFCSEEWKQFMNNHLKLAAEVMYKKICVE